MPTARSPEDLGRLFSDAMNAGDIDALMALYEPQATLSPQPGTTVTGTAAIREALGGFIAAKAKVRLQTKVLAKSGELALATSKWQLDATGPDGKPMRMGGESVEVARRQGDGSWRFAIDTPWGLEWS